MTNEKLEKIKLDYSYQTEYRKDRKSSKKNNNKEIIENSENINNLNTIFKKVYKPFYSQNKINDLSILQTTIATIKSENQKQKITLEEELKIDEDNTYINDILFPRHKSIDSFYKHKNFQNDILNETTLTTTCSTIITNNSINNEKKGITNSVKDTESNYSDYIDISKSDLFIKCKKNRYFKQIKELYSDSKKLRIDYYNKLITCNIWKPIHKEKISNTIFFFDWDDTLLCTSHLMDMSDIKLDHATMKKIKESLKNLDGNVVKLLKNCMGVGEVFIVTNSTPGWAEYSSEKYLPMTSKLINKIPIISAKRLFAKKYPGSPVEWKSRAMLYVIEKYNINKKLISNIISFGDSIIDLEAIEKVKSVFTNAYIKSVKFQEKPKLLVLEKQIFIVSNLLNSIIKKNKNCIFKISKKKE